MKFTIPLQSQVETYVREKKKWPQEFCFYYANRFWDFYQSNGWKVSGKAAMKDWKAAFNSQWQTLKYKEDIEFLNVCLAKKPDVRQGTNDGNINIQYANSVFEDYKRHPTDVPKERLVCLYDWLKENKLIKLSKDQVKMIREYYSSDMNKGKAVSVQTFFENLVNSNLNLLQIGK